MNIQASRCPCGRPSCWHVNIQEYCEQQGRTNRLVSAVFGAVIIVVITLLVRRPR